jgi:NDP-sugar pyrophosphorylase family protein
MIWSEELARHIAGFRTSGLAAQGNLAPWELTRHFRKIVRQLLGEASADGGYTLDGDIAVHRTATVEAGAVLKGPAIIGPSCFLAAGSYVRDGCWLGDRCILGPGAKLKSSYLFEGTKLAHFNFVGDSLIGARCNLEAGAIIANYRNEREDRRISFRFEGRLVATSCEKFGAMLDDDVRIGANAVIAPGAFIPSRSIVPRLSLVDHAIE